MKNIFYGILRRCQKLKKVMCQIGVAQEELREINEELDAKKTKLEKTEDMLREKQEMFADICYDIRQKEEKQMEVNEKCREETENLDDIILRYKVMYRDFKEIAWKLEKFKARTVGIENIGRGKGEPSMSDREGWGKNGGWTELQKDVLEVMEQVEKIVPEATYESVRLCV